MNSHTFYVYLFFHLIGILDVFVEEDSAVLNAYKQVIFYSAFLKIRKRERVDLITALYDRCDNIV